MNKIKVSVIVPVYNAQKFIERCARSLMEQTMKDGIEFIFVNDASPDKSMYMLEKVLNDYEERKSQVRIINMEHNKGVTEARKIGVRASKGEYIGWCDSDDWAENNMFDTMLNCASENNADIVVCGYWEEDGLPVEQSNVVNFTPVVSPEECIINSYKKQCFSQTLWNQVIRSSLVKDNIEHIVPTNYGEDTFLIWSVYYYAKSISCVQKPLYHYNRQNINSLVHLKKTSLLWKEQADNIKRLQALYYSNGGWEKFHIALNYFIFCRKLYFEKTFLTDRFFFYTFRECHRDIWFFPEKVLLNKIKVYLIYNVYFIFKAYRILHEEKRDEK